MSPDSPFDRLLTAINDPDLRETGGAHNVKGVEYQRHWSLLKMFEMTSEGADDFLFLFESLQDVAVVDSSTKPTSICVYQVKKKDRKEWTWADLTELHSPEARKPKEISEFKKSPLGKLYATVLATQHLKSSGRFISNAGCDLPLDDGTNMATSLPRALDRLSSNHLDLLSKGLQLFHDANGSSPDPSLIHLERVALHPDDPKSSLVGKVHTFLLSRSERHAGQAQALVDALIAKIAPLGAKTDTVSTFDEIEKTRGFSKSDFDNALGALEQIPDVSAYFDHCLNALAAEGMPFLKTIAIKTAAASYYRRQVIGSASDEDARLHSEADQWIKANPPSQKMLPFLTAGVDHLAPTNPDYTSNEIAAHLLLRAISICVVPT